jgi:hypothetical protein
MYVLVAVVVQRQVNNTHVCWVVDALDAGQPQVRRDRLSVAALEVERLADCSWVAVPIVQFHADCADRAKLPRRQALEAGDGALVPSAGVVMEHMDHISHSENRLSVLPSYGGVQLVAAVTSQLEQMKHPRSIGSCIMLHAYLHALLLLLPDPALASSSRV